MHVGQPVIVAGVAEGETLVVEAQGMQDRGERVVNVDLVFDGLETQFVGRAVEVAPASHIVNPLLRVGPTLTTDYLLDYTRATLRGWARMRLDFQLFFQKVGICGGLPCTLW